MVNKPSHRYIRQNRVVEITSLSPSTLERMIKRGDFPAPQKPYPGARINLWLEDVVYQWMEDRANESR